MSYGSPTSFAIEAHEVPGLIAQIPALAALGALLLGTITSSLIILRVEAFWQLAAIGALLLLAIAFDRLFGLRVEAALRRRSARRAV